MLKGLVNKIHENRSGSKTDETYYSRGKLMISGEYFVLEKALALAVPLKLGQEMKVSYKDNETGKIYWETKVKGNLWFKAIYRQVDMGICETNDLKTALFIYKLLTKLNTKTSKCGEEEFSVQISNNLEFPLKWGLGSSSSLISNLAYWANMDPYELQFGTVEGSGYDIACARSDTPVLYRLNKKPIVQNINFNPKFSDSIYFIYLGAKQDTTQSIIKNKDRVWEKRKLAKRVSEITERIVGSKTLEEFEHYILEHEKIISETINQPMVKSRLFPDFKGIIKSLGAWGGDFILATSKRDSDYVRDYFGKKGFNIMFSYNEIVV